MIKRNQIIFICLGVLSIIGMWLQSSYVNADESLLAGKKIIFIIASQDFQDDELFIPLTFFREKGAQVSVASSTLKEVKGMRGKTITPDKYYAQINPAEYDAVLFIGGSGASEYFHDPIAHKIAQDTVTLNKILGAICIAPMTLANAGILETKRATIWYGMSDELIQKCNIYTGKDVEIDGNIITANGPQSAKKFAYAIEKKLINP